MKEKFKEIYNSNKGWWDSFTSCFVGTLLGIGITFGLSDIIEKKNQEEMQRKITVLSMSNLRNNIDSFKSLEKAYLHTDSVFREVLRYYPDSVNYIPKELVSQFFTELTTFKITDEFSYSDNVFSSNIEVWESIDNLETIAIINDIISLKGMTYNIVNKLNDLKRKSLDNVSNELTFVNITDIGHKAAIKTFLDNKQNVNHLFFFGWQAKLLSVVVEAYETFFKNSLKNLNIDEREFDFIKGEYDFSINKNNDIR